MSKIYGNKDAKILHYLKFSITLWRRNSMRNVLTCLTDTTRFHKNRPCKILPLISLQSFLNLSASVDSPFSQGKPATVWCRQYTMHRKSNRYTCSLANTRKHSTPPITPSARFTETQPQWNYFEPNWWSHERLSDKSRPSRSCFSPEINWKSRLARGMLQSFSDRKDHSPPPKNPR